MDVLRLFRTATATVVATVTGIITAVAGRGGRQRDVHLRPGDSAPDFSLQASDGRTYHLRDLRGQTVVIAWFPKAFTFG